MPLTIKPVNYFSALHAIEIWNTQEYGSCRIWLGHSTSVSDGLSPIVYSTRGFIRTTASEIKRAHNCDNLQLEGQLYDLRFLTGWKTVSVAINGKPVTMLSLKNSFTGQYLPCHGFVEFGDELHVTYTDSFGNPWALFLTSSKDGKYCYFSWPIDGKPGTGSAPYGVFMNFGYAPEMKLGGFPIKYGKKYVTVTGMTHDLAAILSYGAREARLQMELGWELKETYTTCTEPYYFSSNPIQASSDLYLSIKNDSDDWLSALETFTSERVDFGELHYRAISKIDNFDANGMAYLKDIKNILSDLKALYRTLKGNVDPKGLADLYLSYKYGLLQTAADTRDITAALKATGKSGVSATECKSIAGGTLENTSTVRYGNLDGTLEDVYNFFRSLDLLINAENVWELIPFSFVIDWFVDLDGKLDRLDQLDHLSHLTIHGVYDSSILTGSVSSSRFIRHTMGIINYRRFTRHCGLDASFPLIAPTKSSPTSHWVEGTALIIQRLFK